MSRYWLGRSAGSWTTRLAAVLAIALIAGFTAAQQSSFGSRPASGSGTLAVGAGAAVLARPAGSQWSVRRGRGGTLEVNLDDLLSDLSASKRSVLDRDAVLAVARNAVGADVESMRVGEVLAQIPRVQIVTDGRSIVLGSRAIRLLARVALGRRAGNVDELTVGEVLDALPSVPLAEDGTPSRLDARSERTLEALFGSIQKVDHARDPGFRARLALEQRYEYVEELVQQLRRDGFVRKDDPNAVYDEAYNRLLTANQEDLIPLLDGHLRFEAELDNADMSSMSHAERIQFRWQARRWAFGDETAETLFARQEAMERYQVEKLQLEADDYSAPADRARALAERRKALKVELAAMGSYVGFPEPTEESVGTGTDPAAAAAPDEGGRFRQRRQR